MADVSCSVPPSKKLSGVGEVSSKHIYDDVFSVPPARKPNASSFSFRVDDYREIFSPSNASLGDSIPMLDLPAVDRSDVVGRAPSAGFDYAGVFAGLGDDNRIGVPTEEMFRNSKKKAKRDLQPRRPSVQTVIPASKSQEFPRNSGSNQALKSPTQTRVVSKSQEICGGSENFQTLTSASPHQQFDSVKHFGVSHHRASQSCNDITDGTTHIAHLNAVPGYTQLIDEAGSMRKTEAQKTKNMSMDGIDFSINVGKEKRQGKHTRAVSDLAPDKQAGDHDAEPQRESRMDDCYIFDASRSKEEADCKPQAYSMPTLSRPNQSFGSNDYFQRSASQRPRGSRSNQQNDAAPDSSSSLLEEELDVNSSAAASAAAMKRALEEAEAKIRCAKGLLKGQEGNGSLKATFKDSFRVKTRIDTNLAYEACLLKQNGNSNIQTMRQHISADEDKVLEQKDDLNVKVTNENEDCTETGRLKPEDGLNISSTATDQIADEAGGSEVKLVGVAAEVDTGTKKCIGLTTCALETFENSDPLRQSEFVSIKESEDKTSSHEVLELAEKGCKQESGGEWEAARHLSLLISGVKSRLVSFMSKQADTEKIVSKEDKPGTGGYWDLFEGGGAYQVHDADPLMKNAAYQDHLEKEVKVNQYASSGAEESARDFSRRGMEILEPEESEANGAVPLELGRVGGVKVSPDVEVPISKQCGPSEPEEESEKIQVREFTQVEGQLTQGDVQGQHQKVSDDSVGREYEDGQVDVIELEEYEATPEATYKSRGYDSEEDKIREDKNDVGKVMREQESVEKDMKNPFIGEDGNWRQDEICSGGEIEGSISLEKKPEDTESEHMQDDVQDQSKMNLDGSVGCKYEERQISHNGQEERERTSKATYQSEGCDSQEGADCKVKNVAVNEVQDQGPVEKEVNEPIKDEDENWKMEGDTKKKLEEIEVAEETCTEESQEREQAGESCQDNKVFEVDVKGEATVSEHDEHLAPADDLCEHDQYLFLRKNEEACLHEDLSQFAQHTDFYFEDKRGMGELATTTFEPKVVAEQPISLQMANQFAEEDTCELAQCSTEVADDISEHDDFFPATDDIGEQEQQSSLSGDEEASGHDYPQDADFIFDGEQIAESTSTNAEAKLMPQQPCSTRAELIGNETCEQHGSSTEVADVTLDHGECPPETICNKEGHICLSSDHETYEHLNGDQDVKSSFEDEKKCESIAGTSETKLNDAMQTANELSGEEMCVESGSSTEVAGETTYLDERSAPAMCKKEEHSCSNKIDESFGKSDRHQYVQDLKFPFKDERMPESTADTSESELIPEQPSFVHTSTNFVEEEMIETSTSDGDSGDFDIMEEETEDAPEVLSYTNVLKTGHQTDLEYEQKLVDQGKFTVDSVPENRSDESEVRTDTSKVKVAGDQDNRVHGVETPSKRKRWFDNGEEVVEFVRPGILLGGEKTLQQDAENAAESTADDVSGIRVGKTVRESGDSTNVRQTGADSSLEGVHDPDATQRRRRWFENKGEELPHKPSVFEGAGISIQLEDEVALEPELDDSSRNCAEQLVNDGEEGAVPRECAASDHVESTASAEAARRRRRWFENAEKIRPAQKPTILEDNGINANQEEEIEIGVDTARHDELGEKTTASVTANEQKIQRKKEREKRKERIAVERVIREARERAFAEARERAAVEARQKATAASQDRQGKAPSEVKPGSDKAMDAKLKAERAAVERATEEARERALQKAMSEKAAYRPREKDLKKQSSVPSSGPGYSSAPSVPEKSSGAVGESPRRRKAISERNRRTMERAAKALEEKNMRDSITQKEQAERNRYADALDAEVKRWLAGKEGNLRSLLSTLQYILGPESGWQAIPLTDLVSPTAVRKAYKRAALCVHPDKLQQRGATIQQKYICEKVFDLLKDAWQKFNPDD